MPNHIMNRLRLKGDQNRIDELLKSVKSKDSMPTKIIRLYFPIVYPLDSKIISFMAIRDGDTIKIADDVINVIQEE